MTLLQSLYLSPLSADLLLAAYSNGYFPMAASGAGFIKWFSPDPRAIIPIDGVRISKSLRQTIRKRMFSFSINHAFESVITKCGERPSCWISDEIIQSYAEFHKRGYAHSVEAWRGGELVGGLYGVAIGGAFFGESMFSTISNASKAAFAMLAEHLKERGFTLLDTQFINSHTESLGAVEIPRIIFLKLLSESIAKRCDFTVGWRDYSDNF